MGFPGKGVNAWFGSFFAHHDFAAVFIPNREYQAQAFPESPKDRGLQMQLRIVTTAYSGCSFLCMSAVADIFEAVSHFPHGQKGVFLDGLRGLDFEDGWGQQALQDIGNPG